MRVIALALLFVLLAAAAHAAPCSGTCRPASSSNPKPCQANERVDFQMECEDGSACCVGGKLQIGASTSTSSAAPDCASKSGTCKQACNINEITNNQFKCSGASVCCLPGTVIDAGVAQADALDPARLPANMQPSFTQDFSTVAYNSKFCGSMTSDQACVSLLTDPSVGGIACINGMAGHRVMCLEVVISVNGKNRYLRWTAHFTFDMKKNGYEGGALPSYASLVKGGFGKFEVKKPPSEFKKEDWKDGNKAEGPTIEQVVLQAKTGDPTPNVLVADGPKFTVKKAIDLLGFMKDAASNPPEYSMLGSNCADFAGYLLAKIGYTVPWALTKVAGQGSQMNNPTPGPDGVTNRPAAMSKSLTPKK